MVDKKLRVLIADDNPKAREGLRDLLGTWPEIELVGEAADGREVLLFLEEHPADVVILDARMPIMDGPTAAKDIKERWPETQVIMMSMYPYFKDEALKAGAGAFLIKGDSPQDLRDAIRYGTAGV